MEQLLSLYATTLSKWGNNGEAWDSIIGQVGLLYYYKKFGRKLEGIGDLDANVDGKMAQDGGILLVDGGADLEEIINLVDNANAGFVSDETAVPHATSDPTRDAKFEWKLAIANVPIKDSALLKSQGSDVQKIRLKNALQEAAMSSLINVVGQGMWNTTETESFDGIPNLITDDGTTTGSTAVGGLSTETYPNWKNKFIVAPADLGTITDDQLFTTTSSLLRQCTVGNSKPDVIVCGSAVYAAYELMLANKKRIVQSDAAKEIAKAGFDAIAWNEGTVILFDENSPVNRAYAINTKWLKFVAHRDANFTVGKPKADPYNPITNIPITFMGNFTVRNRKAQGVIVLPVPTPPAQG
jgi:hypothetical protein